ncbi:MULTISPECIES: aspartate--ammonia ligase [Terrabacteria group]|uniref:aspartate--ammonia ligase n=1 Tax=Bacillati TaxID=1783272 RepID=UPI001C6E0427|nr:MULTISPECIES: aspartate--ammonia ligase [Terrabacteria group]MBW9212582.1 aspartate--ammonia ligase [Trueperella sp. zg.1013]
MSYYQPTLSIRETQEAIKYIRDTFQYEFGKVMRLERISAPLFVSRESGLNDTLSGIERPVSFDALNLENTTLEVVQSLAKWKRFALKKYDFKNGEGLYTNMNAIRRDETPDATHSFYVDQWDWEIAINKEKRCKEYLEETVRLIFKVIKHMEHEVWYKYPKAVCHLADDVHFIDSQELLDLYPSLNAKEREREITRQYGCVFIERIGETLKGSQEPHDKRAADYDDWQLNGDLFFWLPQLEQALELSSMGIRVDENSIVSQCESAHCTERLQMPYHQMILKHELPYSIGGGIGQSRLCMLLLNKAHIGEVQASYWPEEIVKDCSFKNIPLL